MPFVSGYLTVRERGHPDAGLPGHEGPTDPGYGISIHRPDNSLPPPPGIWPTPSIGSPIVPVDPGFGGGIPVQPGTIWPSPGRPPHVGGGPMPGGGHPGGGPMPGRPARPDAGLPAQPGHPSGQPVPGGQPDNTLPGGGTIDNTLPSKTYWMLCYCPSLGWRYVSVDPSLEVGMPLPPAAQPK